MSCNCSFKDLRELTECVYEDDEGADMEIAQGNSDSWCRSMIETGLQHGMEGLIDQMNMIMAAATTNNEPLPSFEADEEGEDGV